LALHFSAQNKNFLSFFFALKKPEATTNTVFIKKKYSDETSEGVFQVCRLMTGVRRGKDQSPKANSRLLS
jgi:hypothetical protein